MGLIILASLTPDEHECILVNENHEEIDYTQDYGLVALTFFTAAAFRAYDIADKFREMGVPVFMGGPHASALPEESLLHCDAVAIGEAELTWPRMLEDLANGTLEKIYHQKELIPMEDIPMPRWDLLKKDHYFSTNVIQATRGCPLDCEFCSVPDIFGSKTRARPVELVIEDLKAMDDQLITFTDDNLGTNTGYFMKLFKAMIPLKKKWIGEASWTLAKRPELLQLMADSGCVGMHIGFESIRSQDNNIKFSKEDDMSQIYLDSIKVIQDHGIIVLGTFIFGFGNDDNQAFEDTLKFAIKSDMELVRFGTLIPFPGTPIYDRIIKDKGMITTFDWRQYTYDPPGVVMKFEHLTKEELRSGITNLVKTYYGLRRQPARFFRIWKRYKSFTFAFKVIAIGQFFKARLNYSYLDQETVKRDQPEDYLVYRPTLTRQTIKKHKKNKSIDHTQKAAS